MESKQVLMEILLTVAKPRLLHQDLSAGGATPPHPLVSGKLRCMTIDLGTEYSVSKAFFCTL